MQVGHVDKVFKLFKRHRLAILRQISESRLERVLFLDVAEQQFGLSAPAVPNQNQSVLEKLHNDLLGQNSLSLLRVLAPNDLCILVNGLVLVICTNKTMNRASTRSCIHLP